MKEKQKLDRRNTYTPTGAPQARSSVTLSLNREETPSELSLKPHSKNLDVDIQSGMTGQDKMVPALNMHVICVQGYGKYVIIKNGEKKMDINVEKVKLVRYGKDMQYMAQFLSTLKYGSP